MKKSLLTFVVSMLLALPGLRLMAQTGVEYGGRTFYGFFLTNQRFSNATFPNYGFARQTFDFPGNNELIYPFNGTVGIYAAACVDDIYYACPYEFTSSMEEPKPLPVLVYNLTNGLAEEIGPWFEDGANYKPSDMTFDVRNRKMYAICYGYLEGTGIYEMDLTTGKLTFICKARGGVIAADAVGRVFTIDHDGWLYQVNLSKGTSTPVFNTRCTGLVTNQSLEFDHTSGKLYWASCTTTDSYNDEGIDVGDKGQYVHLRAITLPTLPAGQDYTDKMTGFDMEDFGEIGNNAKFQGMYIPYAEGGFDAPAGVDDFNASCSAAGDGAELSFRLPVKTFGGDDLAGINGYAIFRDDVEVAYSSTDVTPGKTVTWSESGLNLAKMYRYDVVVYNGAGDGPKTAAFAYVGMDKPAASGEVKVEVSADFSSVEISWTAPSLGYHMGAFDPATVTYDVVRLPDNYTVAENITDTKVTDTFFRRLLRYSYQIIAKNAQGETIALSDDFVAGPAKTLPLTEDFIDQAAFKNSWMSYDNNRDGLTWLFATTLGHTIFGDYEQCAEYIVSPTSIDSNTKDADEWLISPPVSFETGKEYEVVIKARSMSTEKVNLYFGPSNTVDDMTLIGSFDLERAFLDPDTGTPAFTELRADIPVTADGTIGCVGLQLATPLSESTPSQYFQCTSIEICEKSTTSLDAITICESESVLVSGSDIIAPAGSSVYDLSGRQVGLTNLPVGIYIVKTPNSTHKVTIK